MRTGAALAGGLLLIVAAVLVWTDRAVHHVPSFYRQALRVDQKLQERSSNEFLQQAASLVSEAPKTGPWHAVFTQDQINGWLAVDLVKNHGRLLPAGVSDPRLQITPGGVTLACQYNSGKIHTVFSLQLEPYLAEPNVVALRIERARAGAVPLPLDQILQGFTTAAEKADLQLAWKQTDGDPVALVTLPSLISDDELLLRLETLELREGELHLAGQTEPYTPPVAGGSNVRQIARQSGISFGPLEKQAEF
ncbi:MAG: hypothetical protein HY000_18235 [Planctomycetes bacterium]|nr:hypothetical protein [Planctomycetota bacterium]